MTINEIFLKNEITTQTYNTCLDNNIETLMELKQFYLTNGSFDQLKKCETKSKKELVELCFKNFDSDSVTIPKVGDYSNFDYYFFIKGFNQNQTDSLDSAMLVVLNKYSIRSINAISRIFCGDINADNFSKCIFKYNNFEMHALKKMKNVGVKSLQEIVSFICEIKNLIILINEKSNISDLSQLGINTKTIGFEFKLSQLNDERRLIINNFILTLNSNLSVRSYNAICNFLENRFDITIITNKILINDNFDFSVIKNVGKRTIIELDAYIKKIKEYSVEIVLNPPGISEINNLLFDELNQNITSVEQINIFSLVDKLLNEFKLLNNNNTFIFKHTHNLYIENISLELDELSGILQMSKTRIGQIKEQSFNKICNGLSFIKNNRNNDLSSRYNLDLENKFIIITDEIYNKIKSIDQTNFSKEFMTLILSIALDAKFTLLGGSEVINLKKNRVSNPIHVWKNLYLVDRELFTQFDFNKYLDDLRLRTCKRIIEDYKFNFKSYLLNFCFEKELLISEDLFSLCEQLLNREFSIYLNIDQEIIFARNTIKPVHEYVREALEDLGVPTHKKLIEKRIKELNPDFNRSIFNTYLNREYGFVSFGRSSVFGLIEWELKNNSIKSGTIRSIVEELLQERLKPIHISEIVNYVLQYRPESNRKSIFSNLKNEVNNRFVFFKNDYVGLKSLIYDSELLKLFEIETLVQKPIIANIENYNILIEFIINKRRLPLANKSDECLWFDFYQSQKKLYKNSMLNELYKMKFKKIVELTK